MMTDKKRLLIVSAVYPFPRNSGQQQRVYYKLRALRDNFHISFLTYAGPAEVANVTDRLLDSCDEAIVLPSLYLKNLFSRLWYRFWGGLYILFTGLKLSNYVVGRVELASQRLINALDGRDFDCVLFEYWHTYGTARMFKERRVYTILDMHDILWRSYARQLDLWKGLPTGLKNWRVRQYQRREEAAWNDYSALIAINRDELDYSRQKVSTDVDLLYAPMGTDISLWPYSWNPADSPRRVAYYASLGSAHNQQDALLCYREIMPVIWQTFPDVELWIVGSNPPAFIKNLERDPRVHVTGFVETPQDILLTMSLVLCPWSGTYGFRSRVVEVMALGVPVVASDEAVHGMGFTIKKGIVTCASTSDMAAQGLQLLADPIGLESQSRDARKQVEEKFSYEATYKQFVRELHFKLQLNS
jgi:glycosyltransferase involved in cell wall biosynthesis